MWNSNKEKKLLPVFKQWLSQYTCAEMIGLLAAQLHTLEKRQITVNSVLLGNLPTYSLG